MGESTKVDMLAAARNAQWSADTFLGAGSIKLVAPAKVNLFLGVGARREDGYHSVVNVMHAVALHDVLHVRIAPLSSARAAELDELREREAGDKAGSSQLQQSGESARGHDGPSAEAESGSDGRVSVRPKAKGRGGKKSLDHLAVGGASGNILVSIDCSDRVASAGAQPLSIPARDNIIFKAIDGLARALGRTEREEVMVRVEKNIPHEGGLGGGSSNAAAALVAAAYFWGVPVESDAVVETARVLGADVVFFLHGGCALLTGAGEVFDHALAPQKDALVLVKPPAGVSTAAAYRTFDGAPALVPDELATRALAAQRAEEVPRVNNLASAAESLAPELAEVRAWLEAQPGARAGEVLLCGSGATTFAVVDDFAAACAVAAAAQARGWWARATTFSSLRAARVPQR